MNTQESRKEREEEELAYKEAFDYFDWNRSGTIPTGVSLLFTMKMTMTIVDSARSSCMILSCPKKTLYSLEFEDPFVAFHLEPDGRCQLEKKRHCSILEDLSFTILRVHHIKQKQRTFRGSLIEVKDVVVPS